MGVGLGTIEDPFSARWYRDIQRSLSHPTLAQRVIDAVATDLRRRLHGSHAGAPRTVVTELGASLARASGRSAFGAALSCIAGAARTPLVHCTVAVQVSSFAGVDEGSDGTNARRIPPIPPLRPFWSCARLSSITARADRTCVDQGRVAGLRFPWSAWATVVHARSQVVVHTVPAQFASWPSRARVGVVATFRRGLDARTTNDAHPDDDSDCSLHVNRSFRRQPEHEDTIQLPLASGGSHHRSTHP
jgi:hypothetical protein